MNFSSKKTHQTGLIYEPGTIHKHERLESEGHFRRLIDKKAFCQLLLYTLQVLSSFSGKNFHSKPHVQKLFVGIIIEYK